MVMGREDMRSALKLTVISDGNENQFFIFLIFIYLIDPDFITLYRKKNFEILTNLTGERDFETNSQNRTVSTCSEYSERTLSDFLTCRSFSNQNIVCCSLWPKFRVAGQIEIVNHLAVNPI